MLTFKQNITVSEIYELYLIIMLKKCADLTF